MFETVAPDAFTKRDRHVFYETLPASIAIHAVAAAAITIGAMARIAFPLEPPKLVVGYITAALASEPVPPPPPAALPAENAEARADAPDTHTGGAHSGHGANHDPR